MCVWREERCVCMQGEKGVYEERNVCVHVNGKV